MDPIFLNHGSNAKSRGSLVFYGIAAALLGVLWYVGLALFPPTKKIMTPPGYLFPVRSFFIPCLAFVLTSVSEAFLLRRMIVCCRLWCLLLLGVAGMLLGASVLLWAWFFLEDINALIHGILPSDWTDQGLKGFLYAPFLGVSAALLSWPVTIPLAILSIFVLRCVARARAYRVLC